MPQVVATQLNVRTAPEDDGVFVSWSEVPDATYEIRWRTRGARTWQSVPAGDRLWGHVAVASVDVPTEVQVVARIRDDEFASPVVVERAEAENRCDSVTDSVQYSFACTRRGLMRRFQDAGAATGTVWGCRRSTYAALEVVPPNCRYVSGGTVIGLNRFVGASFRPDPFLLTKADATRIARRAVFREQDPFVGVRVPALIPVSSPPTIELDGAERAASYLIELGPEVYSRVTWIIPDSPVPGRYVLYQEGHTGGFGAAVRIGKKTIERWLADGWQVVVLDLPLDGVNEVDISYTFSEHDDLRRLTEAPASPLRPLFLPLVSATNAILATEGERNTGNETEERDGPTILLYGRSTGALLACVYGAVDPRIDVVISDAGCTPESTLLEPGVFNSDNDLNHLETSIPSITDQASTAQLAIAAGRLGSFFFYSVNDPTASRYAPTHPWVRYLEAADGIEGRRVRVHVGTQSGHGIEDSGWQALQGYLAEVGISTRTNTSSPPPR
jgi:hypothetical protein